MQINNTYVTINEVIIDVAHYMNKRAQYSVGGTDAITP